MKEYLSHSYTSYIHICLSGSVGAVHSGVYIDQYVLMGVYDYQDSPHLNNLHPYKLNVRSKALFHYLTVFPLVVISCL